MAHRAISRIDRSDPTRQSNALTPLIVRIRGEADTAALSKHDAASALTARGSTLQQIVQQARLATTATGAAIVVARAGERICLAKSGATAGDVATYLNAHSGILHACLRTGEAQGCDDAEADSRFDLATCRRLGLRSILIVPVRSKNIVRGVIEIFSPRPSAFRDRDLSLLRELADRVAACANIDLAKAVASPAIAKDVPAQLVSLAQVARRPGAGASRPKPKVRIPAKPPIHWTLLVTLIGLPLLMGWMLGAAAAGPSPAATQALAAITPTPPPSVVSSSIAPAKITPAHDPPAAEQTAHDISTNESVAPARPVLISEDFANTYLLRRVEPDYPSEARNLRIQGTLMMKVIVGKDGLVERVSRVEGDSHLAVAAATAIRQWRFKPLLRNGQPTGFESQVTLSFVLP
jgi:TonB family protein